MRKFFTRTRVIGAVLLSFIVTAGLGCNQAVRPKPASAKPLTLEYWRVVDDADAFDQIIKDYQALHPNVSIDYHKYRLDEYENQLLNAMAEDRGPDMFAIHNTWVRAYQPKLLPMPAQLKIAFREAQGGNNPPIWVEHPQAGLTPSQVSNQFIDQVAKDVVIDTPTSDGRTLAPQVFGLPLSVDTLALYYNKDILNAAGIPTPAQSWSELQDHVKRITKYDEHGKLVRPAAGIGTSKNVERSFDILSLLMMQNGAQMADENGYPIFNRIPATMTNREIPPGAEALVFYTDFANPTKEVFTWDDTQPNSLDAFIAGKTAYFFGYSYQLPQIRAQAPKLNFGITTIPQIDPNFKKNYANYWIEGVSKKTKYPDQAWDFIRFAASEAEVKNYLKVAAKPTARRSLVNSQLNDADLAPFVSQVLTAQSWYHGVNIRASEAAFNEMIDGVLKGTDPIQAMKFAIDTISQTIR